MEDLFAALTPPLPHASYYYGQCSPIDHSRIRILTTADTSPLPHPALHLLSSLPGAGTLTTPLSFLLGFTLTLAPHSSTVRHQPSHPSIGDYFLISADINKDFVALLITSKTMHKLAINRALLPFTVIYTIPPPIHPPVLLGLNHPNNPTSPLLSLTSPSPSSASSLLPPNPTFETDGGTGGLVPPNVLLARLNTRTLRTYQVANGTRLALPHESMDEFSRLLKENEFHLRRTLDAAHATLSPTPATSIPPTLKSFNLPPAASFPIILSSYPRSGNTLLRSLFERFTLTPTGSDTTPTRPLSHSLSRTHSLVGEGITDSRVSLVKTHWPERVGHAKFTGSRVLLVVRNVWDAIDSYWNMCLTNTHTSSIADSVYEKYRSMYQQFAVAEAENWGRFIDYWMKLCKRTGTPLCVVRYEDLVLDPIKTMEVVIKFSKKGIITAGDERRIEQLFGGDIKNLGSYKPRSGGGGFGRSLAKNRFDADTIKTICDKTKYLGQLGYAGADFTTDFAAVTPLLFANLGGEGGGVTCNEGPELRRVGDPYGRFMTVWRRRQTNDDTEPFERVLK